MKNFTIGNFNLDNSYNPYIIAEIGVNHEGNISLAKKLIRQVANSGANAAKFQTYKAETLASKNSPAYWDQTKEKTNSQYALFKKYDKFGYDEYKELAAYCLKNGIDFLSTPFDLDSVDFLNDLVPAFKIASADITNLPLVKKCASYKKPIIMSTGASSIEEITNAVNTIYAEDNKEIILLHCILNYPTTIDKANLNTIKILKEEFKDIYIGYSDHVPPSKFDMPALEVAISMGSVVIEKHFTHDKKLSGNDHYHAMDKTDLKRFKDKLKNYNLLLGKEFIDLSDQEEARLHARRSIFSKGEIRKGEIIQESSIIAKRPGHGISPIHWEKIIGKKSIKLIKDDTLIEWSMFE